MGQERAGSRAASRQEEEFPTARTPMKPKARYA